MKIYVNIWPFEATFNFYRCLWTRYLTRDVPANASVLRYKSTVLGDTIKGTLLTVGTKIVLSIIRASY
jgi:hypothetical protein